MFLAAARPMKVEWKIKPYLGVLPRVFKALQHTRERITSVEQGQGPRHSSKTLPPSPQNSTAPPPPPLHQQELTCQAKGKGEALGSRSEDGGSSCHVCLASTSSLRPHRPAITAAALQLYLKRAFSAPRIWTVEAGYLARLVRLPAWEIRRAPTCRQKKQRKKTKSLVSHTRSLPENTGLGMRKGVPGGLLAPSSPHCTKAQDDSPPPSAWPCGWLTTKAYLLHRLNLQTTGEM